jgi:hypothetical protein
MPAVAIAVHVSEPEYIRAWKFPDSATARDWVSKRRDHIRFRYTVTTLLDPADD